MHPLINGAFEATAYFNLIPAAKNISEERIIREETMPPSLKDRLYTKAGIASALVADAAAAGYFVNLAMDESLSPWLRYTPITAYGVLKAATNLGTWAFMKITDSLEKKVS